MLNTVQLPSMAVEDGFHTHVLPMLKGSAPGECKRIAAGNATQRTYMEGELWRLPPMAIKLKGVMATTKPSRDLYSILFHTPCNNSVRFTIESDG